MFYPRRHRALKLLVYTWLLTVALWSLLPSPTIRYEKEALHNERTLRSSHTLTAVDSDPLIFRETSRGNGAGRAIFQWRILEQLNRKSEVELLLLIGENEPINLSELKKESNNYHYSKPKNTAVRTPFFDPRRFDFQIAWLAHDENADVCLPWFHSSDKILLTHSLRGGKSLISLRAVVDDDGVVEIWPASFVESTLAELEKVRAKPEAKDYEESQLLEEALQFLHESGRPIIKLGGDMMALDRVLVPYVRGYLPSKTYHIRETMLAFLGSSLHIALLPLFLVASLLPFLNTAIMIILIDGGLACAGIMLSAWLREGRPEFWPWTRTFWMTRWMYFRPEKGGHVWGPAGPVESDRTVRKEWAAKRFTGLKRPKTARFGRGPNAV